MKATKIKFCSYRFFFFFFFEKVLFDRFASEEEETAVITYLLDSLPLVTSVITKHDIKPFFFFF